MHLAVPSHSKAGRVRRLTIAGLAIAGAGLFAMTAQTTAGPLVQQHDVKLVSGEVDLTQFFTNTSDNLASLQTEGAASSAALSEATGNVTEHFGTQISNAITGFDTGVNNALFGGWYGGDDGYVFGLFGGQPVTGPNGATETGSLIAVLSKDFANISTNPNGTEQLYSDLNNYELEVLDHTLKPLLAPLLNETVKLADGTRETVYSIPSELSTIQTNLINTFGTYTELKNISETFLSPQISAQFELTQDLDAISAAYTAGDNTTALTDLNNLGSDVLNAYVNGFDPGVGGEAAHFPGLIGEGSFLDELYTTWTTQYITALGSLATESATAGASETVTSSTPDFLTGLLGGL